MVFNGLLLFHIDSYSYTLTNAQSIAVIRTDIQSYAVVQIHCIIDIVLDSIGIVWIVL